MRMTVIIERCGAVGGRAAVELAETDPNPTLGIQICLSKTSAVRIVRRVPVSWIHIYRDR